MKLRIMLEIDVPNDTLVVNVEDVKNKLKSALPWPTTVTACSIPLRAGSAPIRPGTTEKSS